MALEIISEIANAHEDSVCCIAYDRAKRTAYTVAEGDKAIKVWDLKTGALLRTQTVHRGMVTSVVYAPSAHLLFSASIDGAIGVWTDKGTLLQLVPTGWPLFSLAWCERQKILVAGGHSVLHIFQVDLASTTKLRHARHAAQAGHSNSKQAAPAAAAAPPGEPPVLKRLCPAFKGWRHPSMTDSKGGTESADARAEHGCGREGAAAGGLQGLDTPAAAGSLVGEGYAGPRAGANGVGAADVASGSQGTGGMSEGSDQIVIGQRSAPEEDYFAACHTDVVKCIVITDGGKIFTAGFDRAICIYDTEKLDKGRDCFKRIRDCARAAITSLALDSRNNVLLAGSLEGTLRVWSLEGRCLDKFEGLSSRPISVVHVPQTNVWWATGRFDRVNVCDPRAPANVTQYVAQPNQLMKHQVELLYAPPNTNLFLAATRDRSLVVWQHNPSAAHRVFKAHDDWVEGLLNATTGPDPIDERVFSFSADGMVRMWELDAEQACDVYRLLDEVPVASCNVHCLVYQQERECLIAGCADGAVRLHFLDGRVPTYNDMPLPTVLQGHDGVVSGLALVDGDRLLSTGHDGTMRLWDLNTMKQLLVEAGSSKKTPITCLEWCPDRLEAALCCQGSKAYIWSFKKPQQPRMLLVLDHFEKQQQENGQEQRQQQEQGSMADKQQGDGAAGKPGEGSGAADVVPAKPSNMRWLTRSDLEGLEDTEAEARKRQQQKGRASGWPDLVAEAIRDAAVDVPEVTQIRWAAFCESWITSADDDVIRAWSTTGEKLGATASKGGRVGCLFVDDAHEVILAAAADKSVYVYKMDDPTPLARYSGHDDVVSSICLLKALDMYLTGSWDGSMRLWPRPTAPTAPTAVPSSTTIGIGGGALTEESTDGEDAAGAWLRGNGGPAAGEGGRQRDVGAGGVGASKASQGMQQADRAMAAMSMLMGRASETGSSAGGAGRQQRAPLGAGARRLSLLGMGVRISQGSDTDAGSAAAEGGSEDGGASHEMPGTLAARLADLGRHLLTDIDEEFSARKREAGEKLGACYVAAAEAAAAAAAASNSFSGSRGGSFIGGFPSISSGGGGMGARTNSALALGAANSMAAAAAAAGGQGSAGKLAALKSVRSRKFVGS